MILYQLSITVYTINSNYHQCSIIILVIIVITISITSHQHSIIIIGHGNSQQSSIIGFKEGCRFPIFLLMQCLDTNVTFSHIVSEKHMLVSNKHQQCYM